MKKFILALFTLLSLGLVSCSQKDNGKVLVVYFSATGNTAEAADKLARVTDGTLYEIVPERPYSTQDLDYNDHQSRSWIENITPELRPAIESGDLEITDYDVIFLGYPIWWEKAPLVVNTFIESHDLTGKTLIPFATSESSTIERSEAALNTTYPGLTWKEGKLFNGMNEKEVKKWAKEILN